MLLTIRTTHQPATDLGFLLHKNPARVQSFPQSFGQAHVFYPEATADGCTVALLLDVDPVGLVRGRGARSSAGEGGMMDQYVNDRPYVASSFMSVAIADVFGTAMAGRSKDRPALATMAIPLQAHISALPSRGGEALLRALFEPLGYAVDVTAHALDASHPEWGQSRYCTVELSATRPLSELLSHLYVLIPVLDDEKHYWVGADEVDKLLRHGDGWLADHPARDVITRRYLRHQRGLVADAIDRLIVTEQPIDDAEPDGEDAPERLSAPPAALNPTLHDQRLQAVLGALRASGAARVLDLGCGEGRLLRLLLADRQFTDIVGMDVSHRVLEAAKLRLQLDRMPPLQQARLRLLHGSLVYRDARLTGFDAAAVVEVVEHLDPPRLASFERVVFEAARPGTVVLTTPNADYNVRWPALSAGHVRHRDHRFEWTRAQFADWTARIAEQFGYQAQIEPVGPVDDEVGAPTQLCVFTRTGGA